MIDEIMEILEEAISTYNPKNIRYFYMPYNGEIACIPEWYVNRHHPRDMFELEDMARVWLERNKEGDFGAIDSMAIDFGNWEFGLEKDFVDMLTVVEVTVIMIKFLERDPLGFLDLVDKLKKKYGVDDDNSKRI